MKVKLPPLDIKYVEQNKNLVTQRAFSATEIEVVSNEYDEGGIKGFVLTEQSDEIEADQASILVIGPTRKVLPDFKKIIKLEVQPTEEMLPNLSLADWVNHPQIGLSRAKLLTPEDVVNSWDQPFSYQEEDNAKDIKGLRSPQVGALHAVHSHWVVGDDPATIVMPTGTGKTETMLSVLVSKPCPKVLVIVPTDALRTQISDKFRSFGILKELGIIPESFHYPIVGILRTKPKTITELNQILSASNVIVTTINIAGQMASNLQERMAEKCGY